MDVSLIWSLIQAVDWTAAWPWLKWVLLAWLPLGVVLAAVLQHHFAAIMNFRLARKTLAQQGRKLHWMNYVLQGPLFAIGYTLDIIYSQTWGNVMFGCVPKFRKRTFKGSAWQRIRTAFSYIGDLTLTETLNRFHVPGDTGYRSTLARWLGAELINPLDPVEEEKGGHVDMTE